MPVLSSLRVKNARKIASIGFGCCHFPVDMRASARVGMCGSVRGSVRGSERKNRQENGKNIGFLMFSWGSLVRSCWADLKYGKMLVVGALSYSFSKFRNVKSHEYLIFLVLQLVIYVSIWSSSSKHREYVIPLCYNWLWEVAEDWICWCNSTILSNRILYFVVCMDSVHYRTEIAYSEQVSYAYILSLLVG